MHFRKKTALFWCPNRSFSLFYVRLHYEKRLRRTSFSFFLSNISLSQTQKHMIFTEEKSVAWKDAHFDFKFYYIWFNCWAEPLNRLVDAIYSQFLMISKDESSRCQSLIYYAVYGLGRLILIFTCCVRLSFSSALVRVRSRSKWQKLKICVGILLPYISDLISIWI